MMRAFYFANPGQLVDQGRRVVGDLAVDPGKYVVFAKADIGTNVASGYPPPASPNGGGMLTLKFAGMTDVAYAALKPESGDNIRRRPVYRLVRKTSSKAAVNLLSRSRIRKRWLCPCSARLIVRLRACWTTQAPSGLAVMPAR